MKCDMDLIRQVMLWVEEHATNPNSFLQAGPDDPLDGLDEPWPKVLQHLNWLDEAGFITVKFRALNGEIASQDLTWKGQEYLSTIRDGAVWKLTKEGAKKAGVTSLDMMVKLAKHYAKQIVQERLGIPMD